MPLKQAILILHRIVLAACKKSIQNSIDGRDDTATYEVRTPTTAFRSCFMASFENISTILCAKAQIIGKMFEALN